MRRMLFLAAIGTMVGVMAGATPAPVLAAAPFAQCLDEFPGKTVPVMPGTLSASVSPARPMVPTGAMRDLCFDSFAVLHSARTRSPVYVIERLNRKRVEAARDNTRTDRFYEEARLPLRERASLDDYVRSGYDRGHMAPAGDMPNPRAMAQSFSLANIVPQDRGNNRGIWAKIERDTRKYAERAQGDVYVFTGPVYPERPETLGGGVAIPSHLYKLVYDAARGRAWAFWVPNAGNVRVPERIGYDELVRRTGIRFLPGTGSPS